MTQIKDAAKSVAAAQRMMAKREAQVNAARHAALAAESEIEGLMEQIVRVCLVSCSVFLASLGFF